MAFTTEPKPQISLQFLFGLTAPAAPACWRHAQAPQQEAAQFLQQAQQLPQGRGDQQHQHSRTFLRSPASTLSRSCAELNALALVMSGSAMDPAFLKTLGPATQPGRTTLSCMKSHSLTIRLEADLERELEAACAETGRSRGEIVRDALRRQLQLMRFERLRRQALPFGEAAGWLTDDDVFAAVS